MTEPLVKASTNAGEVNMLYLDQPNQVGFSYDVPTNITYNSLEGDYVDADFSSGVPEQNLTYYVGTISSRDGNDTTLGSRNSAIALWHFAQVWFQEFPAYQPNDSRVSIATQSYGGRYGPAFATYFEQQNERIRNGTWNETGTTYEIDLDTLLIVNGCIDRQVQWPSYPEMFYNNTYGIQALNESIYTAALDAYNREGGCKDQIDNCRELALESDPYQKGTNETVNRVCQEAETFCTVNLRDPYTDLSERNYYDITEPVPATLLKGFYQGFLNQEWVQRVLFNLFDPACCETYVFLGTRSSCEFHS